MKDFNIAKYLKEHNLGSHSILGRYVDLNPLKEEEFNHGQQESDEVPYVGADPKLDGFGDTFDQESPVEEMDNSITGDKGWQYDDEEDDQSWMKDDRFADLGGDQIKASIKSLMDDGFEDREIAQFVVDTIKAFKSFKREEVSISSSGVQMESNLEEVTAWEEKLRYYESEVNDLIHDMIDTTQASSDQVADFFQYISTQVRNQGNF